jgi:uracil-DNA glycosylase family 4
MHGANASGRPFTGDFAGILLYETLHAYGFASRPVSISRDDGLALIDCRITNAVRCVPPENKPTPQEIKTCRDFLAPTIVEMKKLRTIVVLGRIAHESTVRALGGKLSDTAFGHGKRHQLGPLALFCSYHCSRYNTNTGVLTPEMFRTVFRNVRSYLDR